LLSVVVRSGPVRTAVNGMLVAPPRTTPVPGGTVGFTLAAGEDRPQQPPQGGKPRTRRGSDFRSRLVADASGVAVLPRSGSDWPAGQGQGAVRPASLGLVTKEQPGFWPAGGRCPGQARFEYPATSVPFRRIDRISHDSHFLHQRHHLYSI
jgi:hypothetical protein